MSVNNEAPLKFTGREQELFDGVRHELAEVAKKHIERAKNPTELSAVVEGCIYFGTCFGSDEISVASALIIREAKQNEKGI